MRTRGEAGGQTVATVALVPLNALAAAKTRLRDALVAADRRALVAWLGRRVVAALAESGVVGRIVVVSPDPQALALFDDAQRVTRLLSNGGELNADLELGRRLPLEWGAARLLVVLGDLPLLTGDAVREMLGMLESASREEGPRAALAPDRSGQGTNALLLAPPDAMPFAFGEHSLQRHTALAHGAGIEPLIYRSDETSFDVDTPADVRELVARGLWMPRLSVEWRTRHNDDGAPQQAGAGGELHGGG